MISYLVRLCQLTKGVVCSGLPENDEKAHFELKVEAQRCTNDNAIETIHKNFFGALDNRHVEKTDSFNHTGRRQETGSRQVQNDCEGR